MGLRRHGRWLRGGPHGHLRPASGALFRRVRLAVPGHFPGLRRPRAVWRVRGHGDGHHHAVAVEGPRAGEKGARAVRRPGGGRGQREAVGQQHEAGQAGGWTVDGAEGGHSAVHAHHLVCCHHLRCVQHCLHDGDLRTAVRPPGHRHRGRSDILDTAYRVRDLAQEHGRLKSGELRTGGAALLLSGVGLRLSDQQGAEHHGQACFEGLRHFSGHEQDTVRVGRGAGHNDQLCYEKWARGC
mmetsp:Transcript_95799/g.310377  ORF Transcript_95799/g.310377 Transcript_95799/m.310377 type:complete len:240 (-) Transcript_95799:1143-1862(-)